jgi:hypothetical protein
MAFIPVLLVIVEHKKRPFLNKEAYSEIWRGALLEFLSYEASVVVANVAFVFCSFV